MLDTLAPDAPQRTAALALFTLIIAAGFCTIIAMCRAGIQIFWIESERRFPQARVTEISAIVLLLGLCLLLTVVVQAPLDFLHDAARQLHDPANYIHGVLPPEGARS
jgi:multicomponent K+:H+ antiporter subunit D